MKLKCAWCEREGRPAHVGEVEPVENRSETHGLCDEHRTKWLAALGLGEQQLRERPPEPPRPSA